MDAAFTGSRAEASHDSECPDIGPICAVRDEPPQQHHTTLWVTELRLLAELGLSEHLAVQLQLPFRLVDSRTRYTDLSGRPVVLDYPSIHHVDGVRVGPGDPQLLAHGGWVLGPLALGARAGVSVPLGRVPPDPEPLEAQGLPHEHLQFGTGTFDPVLGLDLAMHVGPVSTVAVFFQAQTSLYDGAQGLRAGTKLAAGLSLARPVSPSVDVRLHLLGLLETAERWHGVVPLEDGNQGRTDLYAGAGITWAFAPDWNLNLDLRVRAAGQVQGAQLDLPVVVQLGVGRLFHFESGEEDEHASAVADVEDVVLQGEVVPLTPVPGRWTVFDFHAPWCEACKVLDIDLRARAATHPELAVRRVNIVDFDSPVALRELPGVDTLPRLRVLRPDGSLAFEATGPPATLVHQLDALLAP